MADRRHGKNGQILMDSSGGSPSAPNLIADLRTWTLDMGTDRVDVTCFGDTNKRKASGLPDFSGTIGGIWNPDSTPTVFGIVLAGDPVTLRLVPSTLDPTFYFHGSAFIDGSINVDVNGAITTAGKWDAANNWSMEP